MRTVLFILAASCSGSSTPAPESPPPPTASLLQCEKVAGHVATTVAANRPRPGATHAAINDMVLTRCRTDAWTDETKQCLYAIKTIAEGRACATTMTDEQRTAIRTQARALRQGTNDQVAESEDNSGDWIRHVVEEPATPSP